MTRCVCSYGIIVHADRPCEYMYPYVHAIGILVHYGPIIDHHTSVVFVKAGITEFGLSICLSEWYTAPIMVFTKLLSWVYHLLQRHYDYRRNLWHFDRLEGVLSFRHQDIFWVKSWGTSIRNIHSTRTFQGAPRHWLVAGRHLLLHCVSSVKFTSLGHDCFLMPKYLDNLSTHLHYWLSCCLT